MTGSEGSVPKPATEPARARRLVHLGGVRGATLALALTVVLGTAVLAWGADWAARIGAQSLLARSIQDSTGTPARPSVRMHGAFFLPQVIRGQYGSVDVGLSDLSSGPLRIHSLRATLSGVHLPFHDVLVRGTKRIVIDQSNEHIVVTYADLNRYLALTARPLTVRSTVKGEFELTGSITVLSRTVSASATAKLSAEQGALAIRPTSLHTDDQLSQASRLLLGQRFTFVIPFDWLPFGQRLTSVEVHDNDIAVGVRGKGIVLKP